MAHPRDARELDPQSATSIIRWDLVLGEWITVARHRQNRTHLPPQDECPLCPSSRNRLTEIPSPDYDVVVFENRFPSFATPPDELAIDGYALEQILHIGEQRLGFGRCEVVCFTSEHDSAFPQFSPSRVRTILDAWIDRSDELAALPFIEQVFCFENRGEEIGVTLSHAHGQIYAYPFITPRTQRMLENARAYHRATSRNLFVDLLSAEIKFEERIVHLGEHWTAFVPFAARWPLEVHLYPNRQLASLSDLSEEERDEFSNLYPSLLRQMERAFGASLPYISAWHQAPTHQGRELAYLHLEVSSIRRSPGKLKYLAGSESAMGAFINDVLPEETAERLRNARVSEH